VTLLRQRVLDELQRRNYSTATTRGCILAIKQFAEYTANRPNDWGVADSWKCLRPVRSITGNQPRVGRE